MAVVDLQAVVSLPPNEVFAQLSDLERRPLLDPTLREISPLAGELAIGVTFAGRGSATGEERNFNGLVTGLTAGELIACGFSFSNGARLSEVWRLRPTATGTLISYQAELSLPGGLIGRLLDRALVGGGFRKQREAVLAHVRRGLDATQ